MREREAFQELDYKAVFGSIAKWVVEIDSAERIPELVARAFRVAIAGPPGPVVDLAAEDVLVETASVPTHPMWSRRNPIPIPTPWPVSPPCWKGPSGRW